jgi:hypothetical protein
MSPAQCRRPPATSFTECGIGQGVRFHGPLTPMPLEVCGPAHEGGTALLRAHVANLRHKIEPDASKFRYLTTDRESAAALASPSRVGGLAFRVAAATSRASR